MKGFVELRVEIEWRDVMRWDVMVLEWYVDTCEWFAEGDMHCRMDCF